jgi:predicted DNA-binding ArsR family transcriptional regulator
MAAVNKHKTYHTTYYNSLKNYINSLQTIEEIAAITYGIEIPDEYKSEVLKVIE